MIRHRRTVAPLVVALSLLSLSLVPSCAKTPPSVVTREGQIAYQADQVVTRFGELQNAAIAAEAAGGLSTANARIVVQFTVSSIRTIGEAPEGWRAVVKQAWIEVKAALPAAQRTALAGYIMAIDLLVGVS